MLKDLVWLGTARKDVRAFAEDVKKRCGYELYRVQQGLDPTDWKPMSTVGAGVREIRIQTGAAHRVLYVAKHEEAVYVLHAFEKKTQKTPRAELELAKERFEQMQRARTKSKRAKKKKKESR